MVLHFNIIFPCRRGAEMEQSVTDWTVRGSNPGRGQQVFFFSFLSRPDRLWGLSDHLFIGYRFFPGGKLAGASIRSLAFSQRRG
jgi:hypothetical protein